MAESPSVLRDLSACCYGRGGGVDEPVRLRAMRMLVAQTDPEGGKSIRRVAAYPQSFAGCLAAAHCGL